MTVYLVPNITKNTAIETVSFAAAVLASEGARVLLDEAYRNRVQDGPNIDFIQGDEGYKNCDVVVTIGGDGTMLHTARKTMIWGKPLLGVNTGRLGFLALVEKNELDKLRRLPKGDYTVEQRGMLQATCSGNGEPFKGLALNDVVLFKESVEKTIGLDIFCDDILVSSFRGDGVVFATPTGSTAYSMSAGGPILDARLGGIVVTQICAHIVRMPPMVFAENRVLRVIPLEADTETIMMSCDGVQNRALQAGEEIYISQSEDARVPLIQFGDADQLKTIDTKLKGR